jgi:hypothetical protein
VGLQWRTSIQQDLVARLCLCYTTIHERVPGAGFGTRAVKGRNLHSDALQYTSIAVYIQWWKGVAFCEWEFWNFPCDRLYSIPFVSTATTYTLWVHWVGCWKAICNKMLWLFDRSDCWCVYNGRCWSDANAQLVQGSSCAGKLLKRQIPAGVLHSFCRTLGTHSESKEATMVKSIYKG